jgi:hypothetical protein
VASAEGPLVADPSGEIAGLGPSPVVLTLTLDSGATVGLAGRPEDREALAGPFAAALL